MRRPFAAPATLGALALATAGLAATTAPTAGAAEQAALYGCASWIPGSWANYAIASCDGGSGTYRAVAYCRTASATTIVRYGPWKRPVAGSYAFCTDHEKIYSHAIQTSS